MAAGRRTNRAEMVRVDVVFGGVGPQPAHRCFAVLDLGWEAGGGHEPIADGGRDVAAPRQQLGHRIHVLPLTLIPAPAVNADHGWEWSAALLGQGKVELQFHRVGSAVNDVTLNTNLRLLSLRYRRDCEGTSKGHEHHPREP